MDFRWNMYFQTLTKYVFVKICIWKYVFWQIIRILNEICIYQNTYFFIMYKLRNPYFYKYVSWYTKILSIKFSKQTFYFKTGLLDWTVGNVSSTNKSRYGFSATLLLSTFLIQHFAIPIWEYLHKNIYL